MSKLLEIKDLYVQYHTDESVVHALNGFSLDLEKSEILGLVGETGAGKTTMALSVLRLLPEDVGRITAGSMEFDGITILDASKRHMRDIRGSEISMIFQDPMTSLNPIMSVGEQIREVLHLHNPDMSKTEQNKRVDEIMIMVGISPERKEEYPYQFSGGMRQRIVIAMALVAEPKLLIADEPTTALDVTIQAQILVLMKNIQEKLDSPMIFITHDLGIVAEFCENVAVIYAGEVIERGTVEQVFAQEQNHPYTEGLFACIPNLTSTLDRLPNLEGTMIDPTNLPPGCKFAERCQKRMDICEQQNPALNVFMDGHSIKCHLFTSKEDMDFGQ